MKKFLLILAALSGFFVVQNVGFIHSADAVTRLYDRSTGDIVDADKDDAEWDNTNSAINTHIADTAAHGVTGNVVGTAGAQTLSGPKSLTSPIITNSPTAAGATWANLGTVSTFMATSGTLQNVAISNSTLSGTSNITGQVNLTSGQKITLDGNDDYIINSANGQNDLYAAGVLTLRTTSAGDLILGRTLSLTSGFPFYLDGTNDYLTNESDGVNILVSAGTETFRTKSSGEFLLSQALSTPTAKYMNQNSSVKANGVYSSSTVQTVTGYNVNLSSSTNANPVTINFNTAFADTNYSCTFTASGTTVTTQPKITTKNVGSMVVSYSKPDAADGFDFICTGNQ